MKFQSPEQSTESESCVGHGGQEDIGTKALRSCAIENYCRFYGLPAGCATIEQVVDSSAGIYGWAAYDGPSIAFEQSPMYPNSKPRQEIIAARQRNDHLDLYLSDEGQDELKELADRRNVPPSDKSLSALSYASNCLSAASTQADGWIQLELTAGSGACDSVDPRTGACEGFEIFPSLQSEHGFSYEVANGQELPCLGERRLQMRTEGSDLTRVMAIQVADVRKPLLSLSRCADAGYERRFGKRFGCLYDTTNGDMIPLERRGNLYFLKCWVRQAPNASEPFGRQR